MTAGSSPALRHTSWRSRGDSQVTWFEGDWGEYADWVKETRGPDALEPHRVKFKPLVRA